MSGLKTAGRFSCDIFCHVVDNFGDIGVSWRLARQLAQEFELRVRLLVDDLASLQKLLPASDALADRQVVEGVEVCRWHDAMALAPADLVIETFGCHLPAAYIAAMAAVPRAPVWINLEYLSAEAWIGSHHLLPSIHPRSGLIKHFFFPGFSADTGRLIRERDLLLRRDRYRESHSQGGAAELRVLVFGYANTALAALLAAMDVTRGEGQILVCTIPRGALAIQAKLLNPGIDLRLTDFVAQRDFDELLWANDFLFVRGEDSLVRAQWAAKPFIWQIYPQAGDVHWKKLHAFLDIYCTGLQEPAATALRDLTQAWNAQDAKAIGPAWRGVMAHLGALRQHAAAWAGKLANSPDLASNLMTFYEKTAKI